MDDRTREVTRMWMSGQPIVAAFVSSMVRDFSAREDIMQEIIAAVIESYDTYDSSRPFIGWLLGIARNQILIYRRKMSRKHQFFDDSTIDVVKDSFEKISTHDVRKLEFLQDCLEKLGERDKKLCELRYDQDLKPARIAVAVGMNANTVSKALQRIREQLRSCIEIQMTRAEGSV